ncbi:MAG: undecaprenyl-diphosphate phosphatase [Spirochaetota bacterium]
MFELMIVLIVLGIVQGVAEFLPVSSSGHLVLFEHIPWFKTTMLTMGNSSELFVNVAMHVASLMAVLVFLRKDIIRLSVGSVKEILGRQERKGELRAVIYILAASIPAGVAGILLHEHFARLFNNPFSVCIMLCVNGLILLSTKIIPINSRNIEETGMYRSLWIGVCQALAIIPGISRSGATITGGMLAGLDPEQSARFSFLMAVPVIAGAGLLETMPLFETGIRMEVLVPLLVAMTVTFIVAMASLALLFAMVKRIRIDVFGYYTIALGLAGIFIISL